MYLLFYYDLFIEYYLTYIAHFLNYAENLETLTCLQMLDLKGNCIQSVDDISNLSGVILSILYYNFELPILLASIF